MPRLSLAKLERHLYAAADRLRQEGLDAATYKDYNFGMLFLKRCSDVFDAEHEGKHPLFDALGFNPAHAFIPRSSRGNEAQTSNPGSASDASRNLTLPNSTKAAKSSPFRSSRREEAHSISGETSQSLLTSAATEKLSALRAKLQPVLDQLAALEAALVPYEGIKEQLAEARAR